jgi:hypothetical protein
MKQQRAARLLLAIACYAVTLPSAGPQTTPAAPVEIAPQAATPTQPKSNKKVILSRSTDANGQPVNDTPPPPQPTPPAGQPNTHPGSQPVQTPAAPQNIQDADRQAITFTDFDLDVHLRPADHHLAVRALLTVRNAGPTPLTHIPLQISSSLTWDRIRVNLKDVAFPVATLNSDTDHTGQLHEAAIPLAAPLAPGATQQLDVAYSGQIPVSAQRLLTIGTPDDVAFHSDWDQIAPDFTGLRGFGNVLWYPAASLPVILGDGARLFDEIGQHKLRLAGARFRLRLAVEFPHGAAPTVALVNGHPAPLTVTASPNDEIAGTATAIYGPAPLGFEAPSLFVAIRTPHPAANTTLWTLPDDQSAVPAWSAAIDEVTPFLQSWLGQRPRAQLTLLDLPEAQDAPYETGALLATGIRTADPAQLDGILAHALTHAWVQSPRAWLSEGVAHFMGTLWIEKTRGRDQALGALEAARPALALAEPESPGLSLGQPLDQAISPVYYRTKATYVFWMLRGLVGDATLSAALRAYQPASDQINQAESANSAGLASSVSNADSLTSSPATAADQSATALTRQTNKPISASQTNAAGNAATFPGLLQQASARRDLAWFFADWVTADKGLPDLVIGDVFPHPEQAGNYLVTVNITNNGYASAEVPVTVKSDTNSVTQRVLIQARSKATPRLLILGNPTEVQVNDGTVPETQATLHITKLEPKPSPTSPANSSPATPPQP